MATRRSSAPPAKPPAPPPKGPAPPPAKGPALPPAKGPAPPPPKGPAPPPPKGPAPPPPKGPAPPPPKGAAPPPAKGAPPPAKGAPAPADKAKEQEKPGTPSPEDKDAMQKRAEERARVPSQFRDSIKHFFFTPTGVLKVLRLVLLIAALVCFISAEAHESYIAITVLEICIVLFFILVYMLTLNHLMICIDWSLLDLINSFITAVFLILVVAVAMQELNRRQLYSTGGVLCLVASLLCVIDGILVTKNLRNKVKKVLGFKIESKETPAPAAEEKAEEDKTPAATPAGSVASKTATPAGSAASKAATPAASRASTPAASRASTPGGSAVSRASTPRASRATTPGSTPGPSQPPSKTASRTAR